MLPDGAPLPKLESRFRRFLAELDRCEGYVAGHSVDNTCEEAAHDA